jgi:hypothetical protein
VRIEITCHGKGPVIRAEAAADEKHAALDIAYGRLVERLRRAADRRHDHHRSQGRALAERMHAAAVSTVPASTDASDSSDVVVDEGPLIVREKTHRAPAMTLDQALYEMELVGHDFFLFHDAQSDTPSVVYRRKGYDYGVLHLEVGEEEAPGVAAGATAS